MKRHFPDLIEAYLNFTSSHESTKKIRCWSFISIIAALLERRVWMDRGFYTLYPNLYVFIIGKSGLIKKSTSTGIAVSFLRNIETISVMSERVTAASLIEQMGTSQKDFEYQGEAIKQSPTFVYASELAVFLGEVYGSIIELLTTFFDCVPNDPEKPWVHKTKHSGGSQVFGPCLNILGASTAPWLRKNLPASELEGGFASRILFVVENAGPDKFVAWPEINAEKKAMQPLIQRDLEIIADLAGPVTVEPDAKEFYKKWYENHMGQKDRKWTTEKFCGYMGRKGDHILKLAMVRSVSMSNDLVVNLSHIKWAIAMLDSIEPDMFGIFNYQERKTAKGPKGTVHSVNIGFDLHKYIEKQGQVTLKQLYVAFGSHANPEVVEIEVQEMIDRHLIESNKVDGADVFTIYGKLPKELQNENNEI